MKTGVIIARFQTPYLHKGHTDLIQSVLAKHNKVIVALGISPVKGLRKNPYDYPTRERMIKAHYPDVLVLPLSDHPSDTTWSKNLDQLLSTTLANEQFVLYGSRDSFIPYYTGKFETVELPEHGDYSATELRNEYADKIVNSTDFRAGILYAYYNQYPKVYPTVDMAVFRNNKTDILLGKKSTNYKWRLIGGFADPEDENFEAAARRELKEEAGDIEVENVQYELSRKVNDWRYKNEVDKIITTVFSCDYVFGNPVGQDDIIEVKWFSVSELSDLISADTVSEEHIPLFRHLYKKYVR